MTDQATFFFPRSKKDDTAVVIPWREGGSFMICGKGADKVPDPDGGESRGSYELRLRQKLTQGGLIVFVYELHPDKIDIDVVEGQKGFTAPQQLVRLRPDGGAQWEKLSAAPFTINAGEHLLIPASRACETELLDFLSRLDWLPADYERSFLNLIRRPSLEWRVARIERQLAAERPQPAEAQAVTPVVEGENASQTVVRRKPRWRYFPTAVPSAFALLCAVMALIVGGIAGYALNSSPKTTETQGQNPPNQGGTPPTTPAQGGAPPNIPPPSPAKLPPQVETALNELLAALGKSADPAIHTLYVTHSLGAPTSQRDPKKIAAAIKKMLLLYKTKLRGDSADLSDPKIDRDSENALGNNGGGLTEPGRNLMEYFKCLATSQDAAACPGDVAKIAGSLNAYTKIYTPTPRPPNPNQR